MYHLAVNIGEKFGSPFGKTQGFGSLVSTIVSNGIVLAGVTLFFLFIFGGISMISGAGNSDPKAVANGKQAVTWAVIGFVVVFSAYWIVQVIEYLTGVAILNPVI